MSPRISMIIGFRNRDRDRVARCVKSISNQKFRDFELVFVDYGSDDSYIDDIKHIVSAYDFVNYIYNDSRGWPWNRSHALNTGIQAAKGEIAITTDIDLIFPPNFLEYVDSIYDPEYFQHGLAYYLPEGFNDYDALFKDPFSFLGKYPLADDDALGMCQIVSREKYLATGGFDEFYRVWGVEDLDMHYELEQLGLKMKWLEFDQAPVYHQWHPRGDITDPVKAPKALLDEMFARFNQKKAGKPEPAYDEYWGKIYESSERPAYKAYVEADGKIPNEFATGKDTASSIMKFIRRFHMLKAGESISVNLEFNEGKGKIQDFAESMNSLIAKTGIALRFTDSYSMTNRLIDRFELRDWFFFFIIYNWRFYTDYYFSFNGRELKVIIVK